MTRRIQVNLTVFVLLGAVLSIWALRNVLKVDVFAQPYRITAQFSSSPGLQPGFDITYLGVAVGKIRTVRLDGTMVVVDFAIDKGRRIPQGVTANAALKSAIGEPFVDLEPAAGMANAPALRPGDVIPLARTTVSETYANLFASVTTAVNGLDPAGLRTISRELALGLDGRGDSLRQTVDGASQLVGTFARNTDTLDGLITNLGSLTRVLAVRRGDLATGISSTAALTASLAEVDDALVQIRDNAPDLLARSAAVLRKSRPALECALSALDMALPTILATGNVQGFDESMRWAPQVSNALKGVLTTHNGDPNLNLTFKFTAGPVKGALEYRDLLPLPLIPKIPTCDGIPLPEQQIPPMTKPTATAKPDAATNKPVSAPATVTIRKTADGTHDDPTSWLVYIPPIVAVLILLRVVIGSFGLFRHPNWKRRDS